ncbi:MAG: extracellular solute-binding protein [Lachnospiraceae bacterium]|jgi:fructooligosaccharide transport system substrate-binding protein|nr:extracellular solute-binding protein [Lachnospiraceae bacterium]
MKVKKLLSGLLIAAMCMSLTACGSEAEVAKEPNSEASEDSTEDKGAGETVIHLMMSNSQEIGVSAAVEAFNEAYAGKIRCEADYISFNDVFETLEVLMSNQSTEYDIFAADGPNVSAYVNRGYLQPLNEWISDDEIAMFTDSMITEGTVNGQFYGAPMGDSSLVMYYNIKLLEEAGIEIDFDSVTPDNRLTWEELTEYAKQALAVLDPDGNNGIYGIEFQQVGRVYQMNVLANSLGGAQISENGLSVDGVINTDSWYEALEFYQTNVENGIFTRGIGATDTSNYFQSGKILFYLGTTALPATFEKNGFTDYDYTYVPCFEGHESDVRTSCGSWTIGMNVYSEKQEAAAEFIKYLTLYDGADVYIDASGMVPALSRQFTDELKTEKPFMEMAEYEALNTSLVRAVTPAYNEYNTAMDAMWDNVRNGADIKESVDNCIAELTTAFKEYE